MSISYAARAEDFRSRAKLLRERAGRSSTIRPYAGGISRIDKELQEADPDWDRPWFEREQYDHYGTRYDRNRYYQTSS